MAEPVEIPIVVRGEQQAIATLKSIKDLLTDIERAGAKIGFGGAGGGRVANVGAAFDSSLSVGYRGGRPGPVTDYMSGGERVSAAIESVMARGVSGLGLDLFKSGIDLATQGLKTFAGFLINDVVKPFTVLQTSAQQVANASGGRITGAEIENRVRTEKLKSNISEPQLLEAAAKFQDLTGESVLAFQMLDTIGMLTKGRGGTATEQASFAASVWKQGMSKADLDRLLMGFTGQGDIGSIPLAQMAKLGGKVVAPAGEMGGDYAKRLLTSTGLLQASRPGFGTTDLAATGLNTFFTNVSTNMKKLEKGGFGAFFETGEEGKRVVSDPAKLIGALLAKTSGNIGDLKALGFTDPGARLIRSFGEQFKGGYAAARARGEDEDTARKSAGAAVEAYIKTFVNATSSMEAESKKRDAVMATTGEKWESAMNKIKDKMLVVMPAVERLVDSFEQRAPDIADAAEKLADSLASVAEFLDKWVLGRDTTTEQGRKREFGRETRQLGRAAEEIERAGGGVSMKRFVQGENVMFQAREKAIAALEKTAWGRGQKEALGGMSTFDEGFNLKERTRRMRYFLEEIRANPEAGMRQVEAVTREQGGQITKEQADILKSFADEVRGAAKEFGTLKDAIFDAVKGLNNVADSAGEAAKAKPLGQ